MANKFYNDDINKGIIVDWKEVQKEYKKLGCPNNVYDASRLPFASATYFQLLSERSTGKTTSVLLLAGILYRKYGIITQYIRTREDMIQNKTIKELFKTVREFHYIEKLTDNKYNDVIYSARKWYYCRVDENGEIVEKSPNHFMYCLSIDRAEMYKSSYNAPTGDFIIFDEFIGKYYRLNEFVDFMDLLKTIIRDRVSPKIVMLANTINKHSEYFSEFEIYDEIQLLEYGSHEIIKTEKGTAIYVELIADKKEKNEKTKINNLFFGFKNPKINSIVGGEWATNEYPHIENGYKLIQNGVYIESHGKLLALDFVEYENFGICINCHKATRTYDDSIIYSLEEPKDSRYRFYMGTGDRLDKLIAKLVNSHHIRFQNNACGTIFYNHYSMKLK